MKSTSKLFYHLIVSLLLIQMIVPYGIYPARAKESSVLTEKDASELGREIGEMLSDRFYVLFVDPGVCWVEGSATDMKASAVLDGKTVDCEKEQKFFDEIILGESTEPVSSRAGGEVGAKITPFCNIPSHDAGIPPLPLSVVSPPLSQAIQDTQEIAANTCGRGDRGISMGGCLAAIFDEYSGAFDWALKKVGIRDAKDSPTKESCLAKVFNVLWSNVTSLMDLASLAWEGVKYAWNSFWGMFGAADDAASDSALVAASAPDGATERGMVSKIGDGLMGMMKDLYTHAICTEYIVKENPDTGVEEQVCAYEIPNSFLCFNCRELKNILCSLGGVALDFMLGGFLIKGAGTGAKVATRMTSAARKRIGKVLKKAMLKKGGSVVSKVAKVSALSGAYATTGAIEAGGLLIGKTINKVGYTVTTMGKKLFLPVKYLTRFGIFKPVKIAASMITRLPGGKWMRELGVTIKSGAKEIEKRKSRFVDSMSDRTAYIEARIETGGSAIKARAHVVENSGDRLEKAKIAVSKAIRQSEKVAKGKSSKWAFFIGRGENAVKNKLKEAKDALKDAVNLHSRAMRRFAENHGIEALSSLPKMSREMGVRSANNLLNAAEEGVAKTIKIKALNKATKQLQRSGHSKEEAIGILTEKSASKLVSNKRQLYKKAVKNFSPEEIDNSIEQAYRQKSAYTGFRKVSDPSAVKKSGAIGTRTGQPKTRQRARDAVSKPAPQVDPLTRMQKTAVRNSRGKLRLGKDNLDKIKGMFKHLKVKKLTRPQIEKIIQTSGKKKGFGLGFKIFYDKSANKSKIDALIDSIFGPAN